MLEGVILAGGKGERFWPLSQRARPKQLLRLFGERTLLRMTWDRLRQRLAPEAIWLTVAADLQGAVRGELPEAHASRILAEPVGRSTAPAIAVAAAFGLRDGGNPLQLVVSSDHLIPSNREFWESVDRAVAVASAEDSPLVTFGVPIARPETGYGYIARGEHRGEASEVFAVRRFHEKPDIDTARQYQAAGTFFWNSGIFLWRARAFADEVARRMPDLWEQARRLIDAPDPHALLDEVFARAPTESVDYGILERAERVAVVAAGFRWSDVGSWDSWGELAESDLDGNSAQGSVVAIDTADSVLYAAQGLIATLGVRNVVVVRTGDVTLVVDRDRCEEVREILDALREDGEMEHHL